MAKKKTKPAELDLMKPVDITQLGSELDCFGKEYDLSTDECKRCGDAEGCAIACSINLNPERKKLSEKTQFKDELKEDVPFEVYSFIEKKLKRGTEDKKIVSRVMKRYKLTRKKARHILKQIK